MDEGERFLDEEKVAKDIVISHEGKRLARVKADVNDPLSMVMVAMKQFDISQIPVFENGKKWVQFQIIIYSKRFWMSQKIKDFQ